MKQNSTELKDLCPYIQSLLLPSLRSQINVWEAKNKPNETKPKKVLYLFDSGYLPKITSSSTLNKRDISC